MKFDDFQINSDNTWQIGSGDNTRNYSDVFFKFGVALVGPGSIGREGSPEVVEFYKNNPKKTNWGNWLTEVKKSQWLILRKGRSTIIGLGKVVEEYDYSDFFSDVDGWDLQHYLKVEWYIPKTENSEINLEENVLGMKTLESCYKDLVYNKIYSTDFERVSPSERINETSVTAVTIDDISNALIDKGLRIIDAENISLTIKRIIKLTNWYNENDSLVLESEIVAFLIIPFLNALGWSEQKIKLEYSHIDLAIFKETFSGEYSRNPKVIIEAKIFSNGLAFTHEQIQRYSEKFPDCRQFVVTNGYRYKYFEGKNGVLKQMGYFNLLNLKSKDHINGSKLSTIETILKLSAF